MLIKKRCSCVPVSAFASLVAITVGITSSRVGINICAITAGTKKYKLIIKRKKEEARQNTIVKKR